MKVYENGICREMTKREIAELDECRKAVKIAGEPTAEERIEALEAAIMELAEVIANG